MYRREHKIYISIKMLLYVYLSSTALASRYCDNVALIIPSAHLPWSSSISPFKVAVRPYNVSKSVHTSQTKHCVSITNINRSVPFRETGDVYSEIQTKHINTLFRQNTELLNIK
jgi:hypothetical protein